MRAKKPFKRTFSALACTPLKRTKIKAESAEHRAGRIAFHEVCFRVYGPVCYFCHGPATDAMHIIPRRLLSRTQRYAVPELNSRPGCRPCHERTEKDPHAFPAAVVAAAAMALANLSKTGKPPRLQSSAQPSSSAPTF